MAEVKWIKLCTDVFDDEKIMLIESMPEADSIIVIWFKLLCLAGKQNNGGVFMLNDKVLYTDEMLAAIFRRPINVVRLALSTFETFGMVEIINNTYTIPNWEKHQSIDKMEEIREQNRLRKQVQRAKQKEKLLLKDGVSRDSHGTVTGCHDIEEEREEDKEKEFHSINHSSACEEKIVFKDVFNPDFPDQSSKLEYIKGTLGQGVVLMSDIQFGDLCEKLSLDELDKYIGIIRDCELKGKKYKRKSHYQAVLDMVAKDRGIAQTKKYDVDEIQRTISSKQMR